MATPKLSRIGRILELAVATSLVIAITVLMAVVWEVASTTF
jgi:hypothetical protein